MKSRLLLAGLLSSMATLGSSMGDMLAKRIDSVESIGERRSKARSRNRRETPWKPAAVKTSWPGQTEDQRQARLDAAKAKRKARGIKRTINAQNSFDCNYAHWPMKQRRAGNLPKAFCPFTGESNWTRAHHAEGV